VLHPPSRFGGWVRGPAPVGPQRLMGRHSWGRAKHQSCRPVVSSLVGRLQRDELAVGLAVGGELEAEHGVTVQRLGEASQRFGAGAVLSALDPGDDRGGGAHALRDLLLGETEVCAAHDRDPRDLLKRRQALVGFAVALAARELALDVLSDTRSDWAVGLAHRFPRIGHLSTGG